MPINNQKKYDLLKEYTDSNNVSSIISFEIKAVTDSDFGVYNCTVTNVIGSNSFIFEIQLKCEFVFL